MMMNFLFFFCWTKKKIALHFVFVHCGCLFEVILFLPKAEPNSEQHIWTVFEIKMFRRHELSREASSASAVWVQSDKNIFIKFFFVSLVCVWRSCPCALCKKSYWFCHHTCIYQWTMFAKHHLFPFCLPNWFCFPVLKVYDRNICLVALLLFACFWKHFSCYEHLKADRPALCCEEQRDSRPSIKLSLTDKTSKMQCAVCSNWTPNHCNSIQPAS